MERFLPHKRACHIAESSSSSSSTSGKTMTKLCATASQILLRKTAPREVTCVCRGMLRRRSVEDRRFRPILFQSTRNIHMQIYDPTSCCQFLKLFVESVPRKVEPIWTAKKEDGAHKSRNHVQAANTKHRGTINEWHMTRVNPFSKCHRCTLVSRPIAALQSFKLPS